jgi:hypothetical protein
MERSVATQPDDDQEPLELTEELEPDEESEEQHGDGNPDDEGEEQPSVSFEGEEPEPESDNSVIRQMRQELRETKQRLREAEQKAAPKAIDVGPKPTMADCEFDEEKFEQELDAWKERKAAADRQNETQAELSRKANEEWQADLAAFETKKAALQFPDVADVVETATLSLDLVQQAVIVKAAADPALFLYAIGKSEAKRAELAKIQDPIKLAAAVARMEGAVKVTTRKAPAPDRPLRGSASMPGGPDKELEKLEKKAAATGDRTELIAYKDKLARAAKGK